ncbi:Hepatic leukemia factor [Nymphon striatum]|nr:Hepatic leukemia factor [Nymphon striatum]
MFNRNVEIQPIMTGNVALDQVDRYTYLGQLISIHRDWEPEVRRRVALDYEKSKDVKDQFNNEEFDSQAAFIGPFLWNRLLGSSEYSDLDEILSQHGLKFPKDSENEGKQDQSIIEPDGQKKIAEPEDTTGPSTEERSSSSQSPQIITKSEEKYFEVLGKHFDPSVKTFSPDELKPQPIIRKAKKNFIPDDNKDTNYWDRRIKNNSAAKKSREARRQRENQITLRAKFLETENDRLKNSINMLRNENRKLKNEIMQYSHDADKVAVHRNKRKTKIWMDVGTSGKDSKRYINMSEIATKGKKRPLKIAEENYSFLDAFAALATGEVDRATCEALEEYTSKLKSINATIKKNNLPLFKFTGKKEKNKVKQQNKTLKTNLDLFSRLFIVMQQREADMDVFFKHENNPTPPALSDGGKLRSGTKSDLMNCLVDTVAEPPTLFEVKVLDSAAVVHMLSVNAVGTFIEYANSVFLPHVVKQLENCQRIDVVWDTYLPNSIKESTREKRGKGVRRKVLGKNKIPGNWNAFLCDPTNKQELFSFLSDIIATAELPSGKVVAITCGEKVEMNGGVHLMETYDHEEADTRILIHLQDALQHGATTCLVRTVDTDVIVILIGKFYYLLTICPSAEIWVAFGTGKDFRYININAVAQALGIEISTSLPIFHSFTGCDTVSSFYGRGKKTAWQAWKAYKEVTEAFVYTLLQIHLKCWMLHQDISNNLNDTASSCMIRQVPSPA